MSFGATLEININYLAITILNKYFPPVLPCFPFPYSSPSPSILFPSPQQSALIVAMESEGMLTAATGTGLPAAPPVGPAGARPPQVFGAC